MLRVTKFVAFTLRANSDTVRRSSYNLRQKTIVPIIVVPRGYIFSSFGLGADRKRSFRQGFTAVQRCSMLFELASPPPTAARVGK